MEGWIKLDRAIEDHWVWKNPKYAVAWVHCLFRANYKETKVLIDHEELTIPRGDFLTSIRNFGKEVGMSVQEVRTFWRLLESTNMIVKNPTHKLTQITVKNYEHYQDTQHSKPHVPNTVLTTEKEGKEIKKTFLLACVKNKNGNKRIPEEVLKCIPPELNHPEFINVWDNEWAPFREGRQVAAYQVPGGLKQTLSGLRNRVNGDVSKAVAAIRYSIEMNYQGIFPEKEFSGSKKSGGANRKRDGVKFNKPIKNLQDE